MLGYVNNAQGAGWFDANRDGLLDLFHSSGGYGANWYSYIHRNTFAGQADYNEWFEDIRQDVWETRVYAEDGSWSAVPSGFANGSYTVTADIDNDGRQDVLYALDQMGGGGG